MSGTISSEISKSECLACNHNNVYPLHTIRDSESMDFFELIQCAECRHVTVLNKPSFLELPKYYESHLGNSMRKRPGPLFEKLRRIRIRRDLEPLLNGLMKVDSIIDFGTGDGSVAAEIQKLGYKVEARDLYEKEKWTNTKIPYSTTDMSTNPQIEWFHLDGTNQSARALVLRHVLEHVIDPNSFLKTAAKAGVKEILLVVPNVDSPWAKRLGQYWCMWDPPRHLNHFSRQSLTHCAQKAGFEVKSCTLYGIDEMVSSLWRKVALQGDPLQRGRMANVALRVLRPTGTLAGLFSCIAALRGATAIKMVLVRESSDN